MTTTPDTSFSETAPAKINLALHITGRRDDGYHLLDSLFVYTSGGDVLTAEPADTLTLTITGPFGDTLTKAGGAGDDNLVLKAARLLQEATNTSLGAAISLEKNLPVASGIGGGSSDAAAALRLLQRLWGVCLPANDLAVLALSLGSDIPPCLAPSPQHVVGVGEQVTPLAPASTAYCLLVNPLIGISTPAVFKAFKAANCPFSQPLKGTSFQAALAAHNDLQSAAVELVPTLPKALALLSDQKGCKLARMSGSGATLFALFDNADEAQAARGAFTKLYPDWWTYLDTVELP